MLANLGPRLASLVTQHGMAIAAGILSGAVLGGGGLASGLISVGGSRAGPTVALMACPGSGPELTRIPDGQTVLATARSADGAWLQVYVGEPGIDRAWVPATTLRLQSAAAGLPVAACGAAGGPSASGGVPSEPAGSRPPAQQLTVDPCTLVTKDEAVAALGLPVTVTSAAPAGAATCLYMAETASGTFLSLVAKDLFPPDCDLMLIAVDKNLVSPGQTILHDVGDAALIVSPGVIEVLVGRGCILIDSSGSAPLSDSVMIGLAKRAVSRIP